MFSEAYPLDLLLISRCPPYPLHLGDRLIPYHLAQELSARGHQIDLIALYDQPDDPDHIADYQQYFRSVRLIRETKRSTIGYLKRLLTPGAMFPHDAHASWAPQLWNAIREQIGSVQYDVVQVFGGIQVYEYQELVRHLPTLIVPYESYSLYLKRQLAQQTNWRQWLTMWAGLQITRQYERRMFMGYGGVVVLSAVDAQMLNRLNPALPLHVIPNGVDIDYFKPTEQTPDEATLLFIGNFDYLPNADAALWLIREIFPLVKTALPQARLLLVGNNPSAEIRDLASQDIVVTGRVPDVRPYLEQARVFISPLRLGAGIKNKVLEAMAMRKAIVATPLSGDGIEGLELGTHFLIGSSAQELASAAVRLIEDPAAGRQMGSANRQLIESRYTWRAVADQYEALYRAINAHRED
jgi:glycosyltransferase involved in cell wall biosynthesis